jgi:hypothetical protein
MPVAAAGAFADRAEWRERELSRAWDEALGSETFARPAATLARGDAFFDACVGLTFAGVTERRWLLPRKR